MSTVILIALVLCILGRFAYLVHKRRKEYEEQKFREKERERMELLDKANQGDESALQQYRTFDMDR